MASKKLIITEKPSVARDFARVLGVTGNRNGFIENDIYVISWCYGHLVEMAYPEVYDEKYKKWKLEDLPFLPETYKYGVVESAKDQYKVVNSLLHREDIDTVYWAGDSGKEGQTIEENIRNFGGVRNGMTELRVWIDSQTDDEIRRGIEQARPMSDYALLGQSGIMRTIEDYSLGINFSRALSVKYGKMINDAAATSSYTAIAIGRVMTCVLGMVVNREREIRNFVETPFYRVVGSFSDAGLNAEWKAVQGSKYFESPLLYKENGFKKEESAKALIESLSGKKAIIENIESGKTTKKAPLLFNLAELQSECSKIFKISPAQSLDVAQELYEKKLTTYPRTDARVLTTAVAKEITKNIRGLSGYQPVSQHVKNILENGLYKNLEKTSYTDDSKVTDHYAIIPTGQTNAVSSLSPLAKSVYELILKRFLAIFYPPAEYKTGKLTINIDGEKFFASAKVLVNPGYMQVSGIPQQKDKNTGKSGADADKKDDTSAKGGAEDNKDSDEEDTGISKEEFIAFIDNAKKGDEIEVKSLDIREGKTSPPKRYTSGNLILAMENAGNLIEDEELRAQIKKSGIGTSATRGEIIEKLVRIKYLNQNNKTQIISPENLGEMIYEVVKLSVPSLLNPEMTASWEKGLEGIVNGTVDFTDYRGKLEDYIRKETCKMITIDLTHQIAGNISQFTGKGAKGIAARKILPVKCPVCGGDITTTSFGYGCSNYYNDEIKCGFSIGKIAGVDLSEEDVLKLMNEGKTGVISGFTGKNKKPFRAALVMGKDENGKPGITFDFTDVGPEYLEEVTCPDCGGRLMKKGSGFGCEKYNPEDLKSCKFFIGKVAGKQLSEANVVELLKNGKTATIRGFKSKNKKSFDACLVLKKNENGLSEISFDFENVEAKVLKGVVCPVCGGEIVKTSFGYGCSNYKRDDPENSCKFNIGQIAGLKLKDAQVKELIGNGITGTISGFKSKSGKKFDAKLSFGKDEEGKITGIKFVFENEDKVLENLKCPVCGKKIIKGHMGYRCENYKKEEEPCNFFVGKIAGKELDEEQFKKLVTEKKTDTITGFTSKKGTSFDARLSLDEKYNVVFDFASNLEYINKDKR